MKQYQQTIRFSKTFYIQAANAEEATRKLESGIDDVEFASDVSSDGYYPFEDEEEEPEEDGEETGEGEE